MAQLEVLALNEATPQIVVPQAGDSYLMPRSLEVQGSVTLSGDLVLGERADHASTPGAGYGYLWVRNDAPSSLVFTDDAGGDRDLTAKPFTARLYIETVANQDYVLSYDMPFAGSVTWLRTKTQTGTCTVTGKVNTTALGGTANSASSSAQEQAHSTSNTFVKGDTLKVTISANASAQKLEIVFYGEEA